MGTRVHPLPPARAGVLLVVLLLAGCPYGSEVPLADPDQARIDPALVGEWETRDPDTGKQQRLTFLPFNEHELVGIAPGAPGEGVAVFRAVSTPIGDETFLSVQELGGDAPAWFFVRYRAEERRLVMSLVDDGLFGGRLFSSAQELQDFVRAHSADPLLYAAEGETRQDMVWDRAPQ